MDLAQPHDRPGIEGRREGISSSEEGFRTLSAEVNGKPTAGPPDPRRFPFEGHCCDIINSVPRTHNFL